MGQGSRGRVAILQFREGLLITFLILSAKSKSHLNLICNRFAAELNHWLGPSQATAFPPNFTRIPAQEYFLVVHLILFIHTTFLSEIYEKLPLSATGAFLNKKSQDSNYKCGMVKMGG